MLGILTMAGNALKAFGNIHPVIKWGVVALAGLLAVEVIAREGIAIYRDMMLTQLQIEQARINVQTTAPANYPVPTFGDMDAFKDAIKAAPDKPAKSP